MEAAQVPAGGRMRKAEGAAPTMIKGRKSCQLCHRGDKVFAEGTEFRGGPVTLTRDHCSVPDKRELGHLQRETAGRHREKTAVDPARREAWNARPPPTQPLRQPDLRRPASRAGDGPLLLSKCPPAPDRC